MRRFHTTRLAVALLCSLATPSFAAWTPPPGWNVTEVPLPVTFVPLDATFATLTLDPLTGDVFFVGQDAPNAALSLMRATTSGQVTVLAPVAYAGLHPTFDPVHRVLLLPQVGQIDRYTESGAPLPPIPPSASGPIAVSPDGVLHAPAWSFTSASGLALQRFDEALGAWVHERDVPAGGMISSLVPGSAQLVYDESGRPFAAHGGVLHRIDDAATVMLGHVLLQGQLAVGGGMALYHYGRFDASAPGSAPAQGFAQWPQGHALLGQVIAPGPVVVILGVDTDSRYTLQVFSQLPTPAVRRSWGAIKAAAR